MMNIFRLILVAVFLVLSGCGGGGGGDAGGTSNVAKAPVAMDDNENTSAGIAVIINVLANDTDENGDVLSITAVSQGSNGSIAINTGDTAVTYTPDDGFSGTDTFTYSVSDGAGGTDEGTVTVTVASAPGTAPVAADDSINTNVDSPVTISVLGNDVDADGDALSISAVTQGSNGSVAIDETDTVTYSPDSSFIGQDTFTYSIVDGKDGADTATVTVNVIATSGAGPYLSYEVGSNIYAVDKNDPSKVVLVTSDLLDGSGLNHTGDSAALLHRLNVDVSTQTASAGDPELLVYAGTSKFWKVDMSQGSNLTPEPAMTETYSVLCRVEMNDDELNLVDNQLYYELPGPDGDCSTSSDNTRWVMRIALSQNYAAVEITTVVDNLERMMTVRNFQANNIVAGTITTVGLEIRHYNADFSDYSVIATAVDIEDMRETRLEIYDMDSDGGFFQIDKGVYWYDFQNKILSDVLHTMDVGTGSSQMDCDATECFFSNFATSLSSDDNVYVIPKDGSGPSDLLATVPGGFGSSSSSAVTPNYIYVAKGNDNQLISIARSNGVVAVVDSGVDQVQHSNQNLYYNRVDQAVVRSEEGVIVKEFPNALWVGMNFVSFNEGEINSERYFLAEKATGQTGLSGATLQSYDPATNLKDVDLGVLPVGTTLVSAYTFGTGGMLADMETGAGGNFDLFWVNPTVADSYVRLTDDDLREFILTF